MIEVGRICKKLTGREAGRYCVVIADKDENTVVITGPRELTGVKRRPCNILHLEPLENKIDIKSDSSDQEVLKAIEKAGLADMVKI